MRSDNGGEYTSNEFQAYSKEHGIKHELTVPDNPEQNGRAERPNRSIVEKVRCLLMDSGLSKGFWAEAAATSVYLLNRHPRKVLSGKTPEEVWSGVKPDLSHLRVFGCDALAYLPKKSRGKLDPKAIRCKMLGYDQKRKAYRLWNIEGRCIFSARNVAFFEDNYGKYAYKEFCNVQNKTVNTNNFKSVFLPLTCN